MAERRMISKKIVSTDRFLSLPEKARLAYFYLITEADDDGFIGNVKGVLAMCGLTPKSVAPLIEKGYLYYFNSGIAVIMHWYAQNKVARDRYTPTIYTEERNHLYLDENRVYVLSV